MRLRSLAVMGALALGLTACSGGSSETTLPPTPTPVEEATTTQEPTTLAPTTVLLDLLAQPTTVRNVFVAQVAFNHCGEDLSLVGGPLSDCMGAYVRAFPTTQNSGFPDRVATLQDVLAAQVASEHCGEGVGLRDSALLDCMFRYTTGQTTPPTTISKGP